MQSSFLLLRYNDESIYKPIFSHLPYASATGVRLNLYSCAPKGSFSGLHKELEWHNRAPLLLQKRLAEPHELSMLAQ